jgi:hypothetical protein
MTQSASSGHSLQWQCMYMLLLVSLLALVQHNCIKTAIRGLLQQQCWYIFGIVAVTS